MAARLARRSGSYRDHGVVTRADRKIDEHGRPLAGRANQHHGATQGLDLISHTHQAGTPRRVGPSNAIVSDAGTNNITQHLILQTRSLDGCPGQLAQVIEYPLEFRHDVELPMQRFPLRRDRPGH